jgi:hypothetical protein
LELFRTVIPLLHATDLASAPQPPPPQQQQQQQQQQRTVTSTTKSSGSSNGSSARCALLFHNDLLFIAHHLVLLGHAFRLRLGPGTALADAAISVDMVPAFREQARSVLARQLAQDKERCVAAAFGEPASAAERVDTEALVRALSTRCASGAAGFEQFRREWETLLPRSVSAAAVAELGNALLGAAVDWLVATGPGGGNASGAGSSAGAPTMRGQLSTNEILAVRTTLQSLKDSIGRALQSAAQQSPGLVLQRAAPNMLAITQVCAVLEQYMSMHIFRDVVSQGSLSALSLAKTKALAAFLFPGEPYDAP